MTRFDWEYGNELAHTTGTSLAPPEPAATTLPDQQFLADGLGFRSPAGRPHALFVPDGYEPNYAYPLVVWLHADGGTEHDVLDLLPRVSRRNYLGLGIRGTRPLSRGGRGWRDDDFTLLAEEIHDAVRSVRNAYHVHTERVVLVGHGSGAPLALELLLRKPEWFAAAAGLGAAVPSTERLLARFRLLRGKRVLLASGNEEGIVPALENARFARLLHAAGLEVDLRIHDGGSQLNPEALRALDQWAMQTVCPTAVS